MVFRSLAMAGLACEGTTPSPDGGGADRLDAGEVDGRLDAPADLTADMAPTTPQAGLWLGRTHQGLPLSFVVDEVGRVQDVGVDLDLKDLGVDCRLTFKARNRPSIVDGSARIDVRHQDTTVETTVALSFSSQDEAAVRIDGHLGPFEVRCHGVRLSGEGPAVPAGTSVARRTRGVVAPGRLERQVSDGIGWPVLVGGERLTACCYGDGPGPRHCAFARRGESGTEIWAVDLDRVRRGERVSCGGEGGETGCVRVTERAFNARSDEPAGTSPEAHGFDGQTLFVMEEAATLRFQDRRGAILGWRAGWPSARPLTGPRGYYCAGHPRTDAVFCAEDQDEGTSSRRSASLRLLAGRVSEGPLARIDTLVWWRAGDAPTDWPTRFRVQLSPDGERLFWSNKAGASDDPEPLYMARIDDPAGSKVALADDLSAWETSADGRLVIGLAGLPLDGSKLGDLRAVSVADRRVTSIAERVRSFLALGERGEDRGAAVVTDQSSAGELWMVPDVTRPGTGVRVDNGVTWLRERSPDGKAVAYSKVTAAGDERWGDLRVVHRDDGAVYRRCVASSTPDASSSMTFSSSGDWLLWYRHPTAGDPQVNVTHLPTCKTYKLVESNAWWQRLPENRFLLWAHVADVSPHGLARAMLVDVSRGPDAVETIPLTEAIGFRPGLVTWPHERGNEVWLVHTRAVGWRTDGVFATPVGLFPER